MVLSFPSIIGFSHVQTQMAVTAVIHDVGFGNSLACAVDTARTALEQSANVWTRGAVRIEMW